MIIKDFKVIIEKMEELCALLLEQESYQELKQMIEQFFADEESFKQYERFISVRQSVEQKKQQGLALIQEESEDYNRQERALYLNSVIRRFLYAQKEFDNLQHLINQYFTKAIAFGRLPKPDELDKISYGCGAGY